MTFDEDDEDGSIARRIVCQLLCKAAFPVLLLLVGPVSLGVSVYYVYIAAHSAQACNETTLRQWLLVNGFGCSATGLLRLGLSCREIHAGSEFRDDWAHRLGRVLAVGGMIFCPSWWIMGWTVYHDGCVAPSRTWVLAMLVTPLAAAGLAVLATLCVWCVVVNRERHRRHTATVRNATREVIEMT